MSSIRVLHIDDEPDIREIVAASLGLDPEFAVRGGDSGQDPPPNAHPSVIARTPQEQAPQRGRVILH